MMYNRAVKLRRREAPSTLTVTRGRTLVGSITFFISDLAGESSVLFGPSRRMIRVS